MLMSLKINEVFGPTIQGEAIHAGQLVGFIRLANCNLACSWCDTPYSWDWERYDKTKEIVEYSIDDLTDVIRLWEVDRVILTGGEPLLQQDGLWELAMANPLVKFDIETNGTIAPQPHLVDVIDMFCVSPKLAHSGDIFKKRIKLTALERFAFLARSNKALFKFVCKGEEDFQEIEMLREELKIPKRNVWIMPEGANIETQMETLQKLVDPVVNSGYNLSTRIHVLAWGSKRGV
jgi:organic radical activating enzyme